MDRLLKKYKDEIIPALMKKFGYKNKLRVSRLEKIVVNMGVKEGVSDAKILEAVMNDLALITGQKPIITRAKKSIAGFKLRKGMSVGCKVTLRGKRMYEFFDRLINVALPRVRDFRGLNPDSFDAGANFAFGLSDQIIFPEVNYDKVVKSQGMDVVIVTSAKSRDEAREFLRLFGMPFRG